MEYEITPPEILTPEPVTQIPEIQTIPPTPFYRNKIFFIIIFVFILLSVFIYIFFNKKEITTSNPKVNTIRINKTTEYISRPPPTNIPLPTREPEQASAACSSPLAPVGSVNTTICHYRNEKISTIEAQVVEQELASLGALINFPPSLIIPHQETYKGINIRWTDGQPISTTSLAWIKQGIDILPPFFYQDHPVISIVSITESELGAKTQFPVGPGVAAYANGLNIFLGKDFATGSSNLYLVDKKSMIKTLFHEWIHTVQFYEVLKIFTPQYLSTGNFNVAMSLSPTAKDFAKNAGWVFPNDIHGDGIFANLNNDSDSQKTTDYGKTKYIEDMADSGANFLLCLDNTISESRIKWWEQKTNTTRDSYCPTKI